MERGDRVPLTYAARVVRARFGAGLLPASALDGFVDRREMTVANGYDHGAASLCPLIYYRLRSHNGGKSPRAADFATRWTSQPGGAQNRTSDCMGALAWFCGFDRLQKATFRRFGGWINTNSMVADALAGCHADMFKLVRVPFPGAIIAYTSGSGGNAVGHTGLIVGGCDRWDGTSRAWAALQIIDMASSKSRSRACSVSAGWKNWMYSGSRFLDLC